LQTPKVCWKFARRKNSERLLGQKKIDVLWLFFKNLLVNVRLQGVCKLRWNVILETSSKISIYFLRCVTRKFFVKIFLEVF